MIVLSRPDHRMRRSYLAAHDEFAAIGEGHRDGDGVWVEAPDEQFDGIEFTREELETEAGFERFVAWRLGAAAPDAPRPTGHVPCSYFWVVDDEEPLTYLGSLSVRHHLTPHLLEVAGNIGYSVRPSARRHHVATDALRAGLHEAAALGLDRVLVTCSEDNLGSRRVVEANGGVLEDVRRGMRRYWVDTA